MCSMLCLHFIKNCSDDVAKKKVRILRSVIFLCEIFNLTEKCISDYFMSSVLRLSKHLQLQSTTASSFSTHISLHFHPATQNHRRPPNVALPFLSSLVLGTCDEWKPLLFSLSWFIIMPPNMKVGGVLHTAPSLSITYTGVLKLWQKVLNQKS